MHSDFLFIYILIFSIPSYVHFYSVLPLLLLSLSHFYCYYYYFDLFFLFILFILSRRCTATCSNTFLQSHRPIITL
uniref:Putative tiptop n=1 Tax=Schistosoma mansoni TaxID=6183 RepID=A0A913KEP0_SCHMA